MKGGVVKRRDCTAVSALKYREQRARLMLACAQHALSVIFCVGVSGVAGAEESNASFSIEGDSYVSIATGSNTSLRRAPAVASVVTAQQIYESGATNIDEALQLVPGLYTSHSSFYYNPIYIIRGIRTQYNAQVLMLLNGVPISSLFLGDRGNVWGGMPVENVSRIEVIRGPGSALYGADAFAGVINVITKRSDEIAGTDVGARLGSFNSKDAWIEHGGKWGDFDVAAYLRFGQTNGDRQIIEEDAQTAIDHVFGTSASLAPGPLNLGMNMLDASLDLSSGNWRLRTSLKQRENMGFGPGAAQALDPQGTNFSRRSVSDITYDNKQFAKDLELTADFSFFWYDEENESKLFPAGTFGGTFPEGIIDFARGWERHNRTTVTATYTGFEHHRARVGVGHDNSAMYATTEFKNYQYQHVPGVGVMPIPLGGFVEADENLIYLMPHTRETRFIYGQDEWNFAKDWMLTLGIRYDHFSDFGSSTNPRIALVWDTFQNVTQKLLYGRAFRAPVFGELYNINNPIAMGNPNVKPEQMTSLEYAVNWKPTRSTTFNLNLFRYKMTDAIQFTPNQPDPTTGFTSDNIGGQTGKGLEIEGAWEASSNIRITGNYSYQKSLDIITSNDPGYSPQHVLYGRFDWRLTNSILFNAQLNWVANRKRTPDDSRSNSPDYTTIDFTMTTTRSENGWQFRGALKNATNAHVVEPSNAPGLITQDLPMPRRTLFIEAIKGF